MLYRVLMALAVLVFFAAHPGEAQVNKKKPKDYDYGSTIYPTGIYAPDGSGEYIYREVHTCKAKWYSDGMLKECFGPAETKRLRLEGPSSSTYDSVPGDRIYYDPGPGAEVNYQLTGPTQLLVYKDEKVIRVELPSGKQTVTAHKGWAEVNVWETLPRFIVSDGSTEGQPWRMRWVNTDETISAPVANSDWNRVISEDGAPAGCLERSRVAAMPPEATGVRDYAKLVRRALTGGTSVGDPDFSADGSPEAKCMRYFSHFFLGQRADGMWQVVQATNGLPASEDVFATQAAAEAAAPGLLSPARLGFHASVPVGDTEGFTAATGALTKYYADASAAATAAESARLAAEQAEATRQQAAQEAAWAEARSRAKAYFDAGHFGMAAYEAEALPVMEWADYMLAWRQAPVEEINRVRKRFEAEGYSRTVWPKAGEIDAWYSNLVGCEGHLKDRNGNYLASPRSNRWDSTAPYNRTQEMIAMLPQAQTAYGTLSPGEMLVFDATQYQWVVIYEPDPTRRGNSMRVINEPGSGVSDDQTLSFAQQNYERCLREARD